MCQQPLSVHVQWGWTQPRHSETHQVLWVDVGSRGFTRNAWCQSRTLNLSWNLDKTECCWRGIMNPYGDREFSSNSFCYVNHFKNVTVKRLSINTWNNINNIVNYKIIKFCLMLVTLNEGRKCFILNQLFTNRLFVSFIFIWVELLLPQLLRHLQLASCDPCASLGPGESSCHQITLFVLSLVLADTGDWLINSQINQKGF